MKTSSTKKLPRGLILFLAWACLAFAALCLGRVVLDARLAALGVVADGTVVKTEITTTSGGTTSRRSGESRSEYERRRSNRSSTSLHATVRFTAAGETAPRDFKTVATFRQELKTGDTVKVIHLPSDPGSAEIYSAKQLWLPLTVGIVVTLVSGGLGWFLLRLARRSK